MRLPRSTENPELSWEYFDGRGWRRLDDGFSDGTANLASGKVRFTFRTISRRRMSPASTDYWIARGWSVAITAAELISSKRASRASVDPRRPVGFNPPEIVRIEASYELQNYARRNWSSPSTISPPLIRLQAAAAAGAEFDLFEGLAAHTVDPPGSAGRSTSASLARRAWIR